jgi:hypothetical protein
MLMSSKWSPSFRFPRRNHVCISLLALRATCPTNTITLKLMSLLFLVAPFCKSSQLPLSVHRGRGEYQSHWATNYANKTHQLYNYK